jgi:hypothetical protein
LNIKENLSVTFFPYDYAVPPNPLCPNPLSAGTSRARAVLLCYGRRTDRF